MLEQDCGILRPNDLGTLDGFELEKGRTADSVTVSHQGRTLKCCAPHLTSVQTGMVLQVQGWCTQHMLASMHCGDVSLFRATPKEHNIMIKSPNTTDRADLHKLSILNQVVPYARETFAGFNVDAQSTTMVRVLEEYKDGSCFFVKVTFSYSDLRIAYVTWGTDKTNCGGGVIEDSIPFHFPDCLLCSPLEQMTQAMANMQASLSTES